MKSKAFLLVCFLLMTSLSLRAQQYNIKDFGAKTDSGTMNTAVIQTAIDRCTAGGGGEVIVPAGTYYTGTVFLKSNVYLHLLPGAVIQGSYEPKDYPPHNILAKKKMGTIIHNGMYVKDIRGLIIADGVHNAGIVGDGAIKGAGEGQAFQLGENKEGKPINVIFIDSRNLAFKGVKILNSAQVTISVSNCEQMVIDGISVKSLVNWNTDGLDVDGRDITISNCIIDSEDDALCFKSEYSDKFCGNITVTNCILSSNCNGLKFGTGSRTGFRNITVSNLVIKKPSQDILRKWNILPGIVKVENTTSVNTGIVILGVDGGIIENINISDVLMTDVISPLMIRVGKRFVNSEGKASVMRSIHLQNITVDAQSIIPSIIAGFEESFIEDVRLTNIHIKVPGGVSSLEGFPSIIPENLKGYPENRMFGLKLPVSGFLVRYVKGLSLNDVSIDFKAPDVRPAFYLDHVENSQLINVQIEQVPLARSRPAIFKKDNVFGLKIYNN